MYSSVFIWDRTKEYKLEESMHTLMPRVTQREGQWALHQIFLRNEISVFWILTGFFCTASVIWWKWNNLSYCIIFNINHTRRSQGRYTFLLPQTHFNYPKFHIAFLIVFCWLAHTVRCLLWVISNTNSPRIVFIRIQSLFNASNFLKRFFFRHSRCIR